MGDHEQKSVEYPEKEYREYFGTKDLEFLLKELLRREELPFFDFKEESITPDKLAKAIGGMANSESGMIVLGVDQKNNENPWKGVSDIDEWTNRLSQLKRDVFRPSIDLRWITFPLTGIENLLIIIFVPLVENPVFTKGRYHYREGASTNYCADQNEINTKQRLKEKQKFGFPIFEKLGTLISLYRSESKHKKENQYYEDLWRDYNSLGQIPPKELFQEILKNINHFPYISKEKTFLKGVMRYHSELNFKSVEVEILHNILGNVDNLNYSLLQLNEVTKRILATGTSTNVFNLFNSSEFTQCALKDIILREIKERKIVDIVEFLTMVESVSKDSSKTFLEHILGYIRNFNDITIHYIWEFNLNLARLDEDLSSRFFTSMPWRRYLQGRPEELITILTAVFKRKNVILDSLTENSKKETGNLFLLLEEKLVDEIPWTKIITEESDYFSLLPLLYQFNQWRHEKNIVLGDLAWDSICQRAFLHDPHEFLLHSIPIVVIQSKRFFNIPWLDILLASNRLDYLIRFLTNIKQRRGGFIGYYRMLERIAENPQRFNTILNDSPKREIKTLADFFTSKKTKKWDKILNYLESQEWGYHGKNCYEKNGYTILLSVGLNQISIDDYLRKHRDSYSHLFGTNINSILSTLLKGAKTEVETKNVILRSLTEHESEWLYLLNFQNYINKENQRMEPFYYRMEAIDFKLEFGLCYSHLFGLILLLEILGNYDEQDMSQKRVLASILENIEKCLAFILENKSKLPSEKEFKDIQQDETVNKFVVNELASVVLNNPSVIADTTGEQNGIIKHMSSFQYGFFLTYEGLKNELQILVARFLEILYQHDSIQAETFASKWIREKDCFRVYYIANKSRLRQFLQTEAFNFIEARLNGRDEDVSSLFYLAFPDAIEQIHVVRNLENLIQSEFNRTILFPLKLRHEELFLSEEWLGKIDWKRIFEAEYTLESLHEFINDYHWREFSQKALDDIFDEKHTEILFNVCLKEKYPSVALKRVHFLLQGGINEGTALNNIFKRIVVLPGFQNYHFGDDLKELDVQEALKIFQLIYTKWDKKLGEGLLADGQLIESLKSKIGSQKISELLHNWYYFEISMENDSKEFVNRLKGLLFPLRSKGTVDVLIEIYIKMNDFERIIKDISNLKDALKSELPRLLENRNVDSHSFELICHNFAILQLLDESLALTQIEKVPWANHFNVDHYFGINNGLEIIGEHWSEDLIDALRQSVGFRQIQVQENKSTILAHDVYQILEKPRNRSTSVWKKKIKLITDIPSFWEIDWIDQFKAILYLDFDSQQRNRFFLMIEIFIEISEKPEVVDLFSKNRFMDIPWDLVSQFTNSKEEELLVNEFLKKLRHVAPKAAQKINETYFN